MRWLTNVVGDLAADLRQAARQLQRRPGFALLGVVTLGLGLGGTIALFSVVRALLLRPLPVAEESRLRVFWGDYDWRGVEFDFVKQRSRAFSAGGGSPHLPRPAALPCCGAAPGP